MEKRFTLILPPAVKQIRTKTISVQQIMYQTLFTVVKGRPKLRFINSSMTSIKGVAGNSQRGGSWEAVWPFLVIAVRAT